MRYHIAALLLLSACRKYAPPPSHEVHAETAQPAPKPKTQSFQGAMANFSHGLVWECTDAIVDIDPPANADANWKPNGDPIEKVFGKDSVRLAKPCAEQFLDRSALATCNVSSVADGIRVRATSSYYNYEDVGLGDEHMKECLQANGSWTVLPSESREWRKAKLTYVIRKLKKASDKLD